MRGIKRIPAFPGARIPSTSPTVLSSRHGRRTSRRFETGRRPAATATPAPGAPDASHAPLTPFSRPAHPPESQGSSAAWLTLNKPSNRTRHPPRRCECQKELRTRDSPNNALRPCSVRCPQRMPAAAPFLCDHCAFARAWQSSICNHQSAALGTRGSVLASTRRRPPSGPARYVV
jgi:hypothetical protein